MNVYETSGKPPFLLQRLTAVWEDSVRATHLLQNDKPCRGRRSLSAFVYEADMTEIQTMCFK